MLNYAVRKIALAIAVTVTVSILAFTLLRLGGDPAIKIAGESASPQAIELIREQYGYNRPFVLQYGSWLGDALRGDLGQSIAYRMPVSSVIASRFPTTALIGCLALLLALVVAVPLGVLAAAKPNTYTDRAALVFSIVGQAMPSFWLALMLIVLFSVKLRWLPASGSDSWSAFVLPVVVLGYYAMPAIFRLTRAEMLDVLSRDFIRTNRAMGLSLSSILLKHGLRNAAIPVVGLAAVQFGYLLNGAVVVESVFAINGIGYLGWEAIRYGDVVLVQGVVLIFSLIYVLLTLVADLINAWLDPRLRKQAR